MSNKTKARWFAAMAIAILVAVLPFAALAHDNPPNDGYDPVSFCHAIPPDTAANGWNALTIDDDGIFTSGHSGEHDADIIPAFTYEVWEQVGTTLESFTYTRSGSDFNEDGVDIDFNDYQGDDDRQVVLTAEAGFTIDFVGIDYTGSDANEVTFGPQPSPFTYTAANNVDIDHVTVTVSHTIPIMGWGLHTFPGKNLATLFGWGATGQSILNNNCTLPPPPYTPCDETVLLAKVYGPVVDVGDPVWGDWQDNGDGTFTRTGSQVTTQHWTEAIVDKYDQQHLCGQNEGDDPGSREVKESKDGSTRFVVDANCDEGFVTALFYDPDGTQIGTEVVAEHVWTNPFGSPESYTFDQYDLTANEPEDCHEIEVKIDFADEDPPNCIGWAVYRYTYVDGELYSTELAGSGTWTDAYSDESFTFTDDKSGLSLYVAEPEDCLNREGAYIVYDQTCERGWQAALFDVETDTLQDTASDSWHDPFGPESVSGTLHWTDLNGEEHSVDYFLSKNTDCIDCKVQEWYPMAGYQTFDAPVGYWSGPLERGPGICPIIHKVGEIPSLERILEICSLCKDQIPGGYLYNPSNGNGTMFTDERVLKITCWTETRGHETHYYWAGKLWDQWIKSGFEPDGTRTCNRIDGCSQEIRDMAAERGIEIP